MRLCSSAWPRNFASGGGGHRAWVRWTGGGGFRVDHGTGTLRRRPTPGACRGITAERHGGALTKRYQEVHYRDLATSPLGIAAALHRSPMHPVGRPAGAAPRRAAGCRRALLCIVFPSIRAQIDDRPTLLALADSRPNDAHRTFEDCVASRRCGTSCASGRCRRSAPAIPGRWTATPSSAHLFPLRLQR